MTIEKNSEVEEKNSLFNRVYTQIKENKQVRAEGGHNCIPWKNLPGLSSVVPGIQKGKYYLTTANSKVGKTQLCDYLFIYEPFEFIEKYKPKNISLKVFYFSLEMSRERKLKSTLSYKIFKDKGIIISPEDLDSVFENRIIDDATFQLVGEYRNYFERFEKDVTVIDNIRNPYGIFKYMQDYAEANGHWVKKNIQIINKDKTKTLKEVNDYYVPDRPDEYVIVIVDHISLLQTEKIEGGRQQTLHEAMSKFSSEYCLFLRDKYKYIPVVVQQQSAESEKQQYTLNGSSIIDKIKPSADSLGDNKLVGRDVDLMFGLFAPYRYKIESHRGYNITRLQDHYRELMVILNRNGSGFCSDDLLFHGGVNYFQELPAKMTEDHYKYIEDKFKINR